ncbi:unnamed protein product [Paramecium octaurelia]|uniref:LSDAT prokaryote domain-containing protein n=1 Tax=Paramecium octaurelia TaxID=43137 RepID=A0A8S1W1E5_PAROT|nr:unnamed protein product [Paramecium octaurelia]
MSEQGEEQQGDEQLGDEQQEEQQQQDQQPFQIDTQIPPEDANVFMTQQKLEQNQVWKCFDFLFPAGKLAKLIKVNYMQPKTFPMTEILTKLKLDDGLPVVNFIGCRHNFDNPNSNRGKFYAGIARACHNTDAVIIDNGITTGIEKFSLRRNCTLIGVAPESVVSYPKLNPTKIEKNELSNGHTHIFLIGGEHVDLGTEALFKINLCKAIATGKISKTQGRPRCKIVNILFADSNDCFDEIREAIINKLPIIVVRGSHLCNQFIDQEKILDAEFEDIMTDKDGFFFPLKKLDSEVIAQMVHYLLTYTPSKPKQQ